jgi:tripartite-type tricarboxylate transporter receptor subunit TctC
MRRKLLAAAAFAATLAALPFGGAQAAEPYPDRAIEFVVGYAAGGPTDVTARLIAQELTKSLGVSVFVTNKVGAASLVATQLAQRAKPDGYTFLFASLGHNVNPLLVPDRAKYDPVKDFELVASVAVQPLVVVTAYDSKYSSLPELLAAAKQKPESISFGSAGAGGSAHLAGELLALQSGTKLLHVPFKGNGPALAEVMAGRVSFMFYPSVGIAEQLANKRLKLLAVAPSKGLKDFPSAPTLASLGYRGFDDSAPWVGLVAPKGTPPNIVKLMNQKINAVLADPVARKRIEDVGNAITGGTPADFERQLVNSSAAAEKVIQFANIKAE